MTEKNLCDSLMQALDIQPESGRPIFSLNELVERHGPQLRRNKNNIAEHLITRLQSGDDTEFLKKLMLDILKRDETQPLTVIIWSQTLFFESTITSGARMTLVLALQAYALEHDDAPLMSALSILLSGHKKPYTFSNEPAFNSNKLALEAARAGKLNVLKFLVNETGADLNKGSPSHNSFTISYDAGGALHDTTYRITPAKITPLIAAILNDREDCASFLINHPDAELENYLPSNGFGDGNEVTVLAIAVCLSKVWAVRLLLDKNIDTSKGHIYYFHEDHEYNRSPLQMLLERCKTPEQEIIFNLLVARLSLVSRRARIKANRIDGSTGVLDTYISMAGKDTPETYDDYDYPNELLCQINHAPATIPVRVLGFGPYEYDSIIRCNGKLPAPVMPFKKTDIHPARDIRNTLIEHYPLARANHLLLSISGDNKVRPDAPADDRQHVLEIANEALALIKSAPKSIQNFDSIELKMTDWMNDNKELISSLRTTSWLRPQLVLRQWDMQMRASGYESKDTDQVFAPVSKLKK